MNPIRIAIIDDHRLVRAGLKKLLEGVYGIEIVAEGGTAEQAIEFAERLRPDVILMDLSLPGDGGLEATARIHRLYPDVRILIVSMYNTPAFVRQSRTAGASGYVVKDRSIEELEQAIRHVARGGAFIGGSDDSIEHQGASHQAAGSLGDLTPRQIEVLKYVALGRSHREIAGTLHIAEKTVEHHRSNLKKSLGINDTAGLVLFAVRHGLVSPDDLERREQDT